MGDLQYWFDHLAGEWQLEREISSGETFAGKALFSANASGSMALTESGALILESGDEVSASRKWIWSLSNHELLIEFAESPPRPYHLIPLQPSNNGWQGKAEHLCIEDNYDGEYFLSDDLLLVSQKIKGPKKDYSITSRYTRAYSK